MRDATRGAREPLGARRATVNEWNSHPRARCKSRVARASGACRGARDVSMRVVSCRASDGVSHPARRVARRHVASRSGGLTRQTNVGPARVPPRDQSSTRARGRDRCASLSASG